MFYTEGFRHIHHYVMSAFTIRSLMISLLVLLINSIPKFMFCFVVHSYIALTQSSLKKGCIKSADSGVYVYGYYSQIFWKELVN